MSPHDNSQNLLVKHATVQDYESCILNMQKHQNMWASLPAPARGDIVRQIGEALRANKAALGKIISLEMGKILSEGEGEVRNIYS